MRSDSKSGTGERYDDCCRICGCQFDELTFEHVPPRTTGNNRPAKMLSLEHWLNRDQGTGAPAPGGKILQRGSGKETFCDRCNSRTGAWYVPELGRWVDHAGGGLAGMQPSFAELDGRLDPGVATARFEAVRPVLFLKQVVTMMLALTDPGFAFHRDHLDLREFAQDPGWTGLPDRYQFYLVLYCGPMARFNAGTGRLNVESGDTEYLLEVAHPPLAYVLSIDQTAPTLQAGNITAFANLPSADAVADVEIDMQVGFGHTPLPADFRTKAKLEADRAEARRQRAREKLWTPPESPGP